MKTVKATIISLSFLLIGISTFAQVVSNFNIDNEGWTVFDNNTGVSTPGTFNGTGGNPGGNTSFTTTSAALNMYWTAPVKFRGNQSLSYNQTLTFDLNVSTAGTDNSIGDVRIASSSGMVIFYQLPSKPLASQWNSYSVQLNESQWHVGSPTGALATTNEIKNALVNITSFQIRAKYLSGNTGPYTVQLDNVVLNRMTLLAAPIITSITPLSALAGTSVTIAGSNFNTTAAQNLVLFKGVKAIVTSATATQLVVTVPVSAPYGPLTVENKGTGLQGLSKQSFSLLFDNNKDFGGRIIPASLTRGYSTLLQNGTETGTTNNQNGNVERGDLDGDGWLDLIVTETGVTGSPKIYVYRNLGTGGVVSTASFAAPVILNIASIPGGSPNLGELMVTDVDSDGLLDITAVSSNGGLYGYLATFRNTSTVGSISFASPEFFGYPYYSSQLTTASGDFDGDGRVDFISTTGTLPGGIWMNQNLSTPGNIDLSYGFTVGNTSSHRDLVVGDLNADGKPEIITSLGNGFEIYENNSTPGTVAFNTPFTMARTSVHNIQLADLDADTKLDLMWGDSFTQFIFFSRNIHSGSVLTAGSFGSEFQVAISTGSTEGIAVSDINSDGQPDVILTGNSDIGVLQNHGNGSSLSAETFPNSIVVQGSAGGQPLLGLSAPVVGDLDGDNKPEVIFTYTNLNITANEKGIYIFHNESYPPPLVSSVSPIAGGSGSVVTLTGNYMHTGNVTPSARVNKIKSSISGTPSNTATSVTNPVGSITGRIAITNHGLTGYSPIFYSTFSTSQVIDASSFGPSIDFTLTNNMRDAVEVADFDDDGKADVVAVDNFNIGKIFKNTHATAGQTITAASLTLESTTYVTGYNIVTLDIDGDGKVDLNSGFNLFQNTSASTISFAPGSSTSTGGFVYVAAADFNKDGKTDLVQSYGSPTINVYYNQSNKGTFPTNGRFAPFNTTAASFTLPSSGYGVVAADFDKDGYDDFVTVSPFNDSYTVFYNEKASGPITSMSFSSLGEISTSGDQPYDITADDFDGDGKIDMAITYFNSAFISVYRNSSSGPGDINFNGPYDYPCANKGRRIGSQDLDGDGWAEVVVIHQPNPGPGSFSVLRNTGSPGEVEFALAVNYPLTRNPLALNFADINHDQKPDILIAASGGSTAPTNALMVFENKINSGPTITITQQPADVTVCSGGTVTFTTSATGTTNIAYQWQFSSTGGVGTFTDIVNGGGYSNAGTATLSVNTTGNFGAGRYRCKISGDLATTVFTNDEGLFINPIPTAPTTTPDSDCVPASLTLTASGGTNGQYRWYTVATGGTAIFGQTNSIYTTPLLSTTTTYYVSISISSCESTRTPAIATIAPLAKPTIFFDPPIFNAGSTINLCEGYAQKFSAPSGFSVYTWSNGETTQEITLTAPGIYSVTVEDAAGCISPPSDPLTVVINPIPVATITVNDTQLTASAGDSYQWYQGGEEIDGATNQSFEFNVLEYGVYTVSVTDNGCTDLSDAFTYLITGNETLTRQWKIYPNPFNTTLTIEAPSSQSVTIEVVDMLGRLVNQSSFQDTYILSGSAFQSGTYYMTIRTQEKTWRIKVTKID